VKPQLTVWALAFIVLCLAYALEEFVLIKPVSTVAQSDRESRRLELAAIWVPGIGIALTGATLRQFAHVWGAELVNLAGVVLCLAGIGLRYWSRRVLGRFFTIGVVRQEGHTVVRNGPYRRVRHPGYLGFMLFYLGLPLVVGSAFGLVVLALPALAIFVMLVKLEDRKMAEALGQDYVKYQAESARILPGIW
jgi:protein-S-isoprenylcysteine O-methyltransferase